MGQRINRCVELLAQDQAIYYDGPHSGHVLTHAQGRIDAGTWADYMNVGMEHGAFDMTGLAEYMRGMVDAGPTRSGHRTPTVIVEAPVNGIDAAHVRYNAWQFRQILGRGVHGILLCQAETADAVRAFVESCRYPHNTIGVDPAIPSPMARMEGAIRAKDGGTDAAGRKLARHRHARPRLGNDRGADLGPVDRGLHGALRSLAAQPERRTAARREAGKPRRRRQLRRDPRGAGAGICRDRPGRSQPVARLPHDSARALPAGDAGGARPHPGGLPQQRRRLPAGLHAGQHHRPDRRGRARDRRAQRGNRHQGPRHTRSGRCRCDTGCCRHGRVGGFAFYFRSARSVAKTRRKIARLAVSRLLQ